MKEVISLCDLLDLSHAKCKSHRSASSEFPFTVLVIYSNF